MASVIDIKNDFARHLSLFAETLSDAIAFDDEWTIKGFIDIFQNVYPLSSDTKLISKLFELHLLPHFISFAHSIDFNIEPASKQNWYPDLTFINKNNPTVKFAVDLKTTYRLANRPDYCNGFTLGSHGEYFINRESTKNIQYPYKSYLGHFCLGIIYSRVHFDKPEKCNTYSLSDIQSIPSVARSFIFFACEKWRIASDKEGSTNTANIGSIRNIEDLLSGNGVFAKAGEEFFDDYWSNYKKILVPSDDGERKGLSSFKEYLEYRGLPCELNNTNTHTVRSKA